LSALKKKNTQKKSVPEKKKLRKIKHWTAKEASQNCAACCQKETIIEKRSC